MSRTRSTAEGGFIDTVSHDYVINNGIPSVFSTSTFGLGQYKLKEITDSNISGYHVQKKCGVLPLNPVTISTTTQDRILGSSRMGIRSKTDPGFGYDWEPAWGKFGLPDLWKLPDIPPVSQAVIDRAVNAAIAKARAPTWDVGTFLGEFKDTEDMFKLAVSRVKNFSLKTMKRAYRDNPVHYAKNISSYWLEYRYGWQPAISDLQSAIAAFTAKPERDYLIGRSLSREPFESMTDVIRKFDPVLQSRYITTVSGEHVVRGFARSTQPQIRTRFGFDPIVTAYEVTKLSFVLDWFIDVGSWLQAVSPFAAGGNFDSCASVQTNATVSVTSFAEAREDPTDHGWTFIGDGYLDCGTWSKTIRAYSRVPMGSSLPGFTPRVSLVRKFDALALAIQMKNLVLGHAHGLRF